MKINREDFPVLKNSFSYIDSACMALKPRQVVDAMNRYYLEFPACGERSAHRLGAKVTEEFHAARKAVAKFIGAKENEIIFTKNTTEGINIVANALRLKHDDVVVTSDKEHNSNFLPWTRFYHKIIETKYGQLDVDDLENALTNNTRVVSVLHSSNIDGIPFPIENMAKIVHDNDSLLCVDGAQSVPHKEVNVKKLDVDFLAFSGHKMLGPSIGVLYVKEILQDDLLPFIVGGGTVQNVIEGKPHYLKFPESFEAGLQNYAGAIGLRAAVEYLDKVGMKNIEKHEHELRKAAIDEIEMLGNVEIIGPCDKSGIISMNIKGVDSREAAVMMDSHGVLVRGGFHCCHNWFNKHKIAGSVRASFYLYNTEEDVQRLVSATKKVAALS